MNKRAHGVRRSRVNTPLGNISRADGALPPVQLFHGFGHVGVIGLDGLWPLGEPKKRQQTGLQSGYSFGPLAGTDLGTGVVLVLALVGVNKRGAHCRQHQPQQQGRAHRDGRSSLAASPSLPLLEHNEWKGVMVMVCTYVENFN